VAVICSASATSSGCRRSNSDSRTDRSSSDSRSFQGRTTPSCRQVESQDVPDEPSPHADVRHARSVMALRRASFSREQFAGLRQHERVWPCRRVWCRIGSSAEPIWACTCRRPSVASGHSKIRRAREPRNVPSVPQVAPAPGPFDRPVVFVTQRPRDDCAEPLPQSRATTSSSAARRAAVGSATVERRAGIRHPSTLSPYCAALPRSRPAVRRRPPPGAAPAASSASPAATPGSRPTRWLSRAAADRRSSPRRRRAAAAPPPGPRRYAAQRTPPAASRPTRLGPPRNDASTRTTRR